MSVTVHQADPIFGGEVSLLYGKQTVDAYTAATSLVPAGFVNVPGLRRAADMDKIFPLGTYKRQQNNIANYRPSLSFTQDVQDMALLGAALRDGAGHLDYYTFAFGNAEVARQVIGAKVSRATIDMPRDGKLSVAYGFDALDISPLGTPPAAMTFDAGRVFYGYSLTLSTATDDYTNLLQRVRVEIEQTLVRLMPKQTGTSPNLRLISQGLKETIQHVNVTFDLYEPLSLQDISALCRSSFDITARFVDPCDNTRVINILMHDMQFETDDLNEGDNQALLQFTAQADTLDIVITNV